MPDVQDLLLGTTVRVFEEVAFVMLEPAELPPEPPLSGVEISFDSGDQRGLIYLWAAEQFLEELAENMMPGVELDSLGIKCLSEIANIVGGNLLTEIYGEDLVVHLGLPQAIQSPPTGSFIPLSSENGHLFAVAVELETV
jgi:CheY-specific phosphatase CheX